MKIAFNFKPVSILLLTAFMLSCGAQDKENFKKKGYELTFLSQDPDLNPETKKGLINTFFEVYPTLVNDFNKDAREHITVEVDTAYGGVAYASNGKVTISSKWLKKMPLDYDMMTHEVMHIVQSYPGGSGPGWLTEGIADYVRAEYGIANAEGGWFLPEYNEKAHYTNSYRITARWLIWVSEKYDANLVKKLDKNLRENTYNPQLWEKYTGNTVDELWEEYSKNPEIAQS